MTNVQNIAARAPHHPGNNEATIFKIPIGKLGLLSSLLMGGACGFIVFFVTFFLAIIGMDDLRCGHSHLHAEPRYQLSLYRRAGGPACRGHQRDVSADGLGPAKNFGCGVTALSRSSLHYG